MHTLDAALYWRLPGPRNFVQRIATHIWSARVLVINLPKTVVPGTSDAIDRGLCDAHLQDPIRLAIRSGTDIASDIGMHFGNQRITAERLADHRSSTDTAVVLRAEDARAQDMCEQYTREFMAATQYSHGNVRLVTSIHHKDHSRDKQIGNVQLIIFDGGLTADEMDAYVALRMANRPGPGSTRLLRAIISEFAGFDAQFAERLMQLDDLQILSIRDQLRLLIGEDPDRWRSLTWLSGGASIVTPAPHILHDFYLFEHGPHQQKEEARQRISRCYWRACLKTMSPWLEERRRPLLQHFRVQLEQIAAKDPDGKLSVPIGNNKFRYVDPEEIEFNNIVGLSYSGQICATSDTERLALKICKSAKPVRDDIAHMRSPSTADLVNLIHEMDSLISV